MNEPEIPGVRLQGELGRGAHSIVYRGEHECGPCAVKVPLARARWTRWIFREAVSLARVRHAGLPAVFEVGVVDELPFLVMELVEGQTLATRLEAGEPMPTHEVLEIGRQLASVLSAIHDIGLVHRDVKPRNIVVDSSGRLRLVDFGFTTPMERTGTGETAGTAAYAAPEQLVPPGRVDARSDLYCVGRVLLECLLGRDFPADKSGPYGDDVRVELTQRRVPADVASVIAGLLQEEVDARYPDAHALENELELLRTGQPALGATAYPHEKRLPPTVARATELEQVLSIARSKTGSVILVHGQRGTGKSLLLGSIEQRLPRVDWCAHVACRQDDPPLAALRRALESAWASLEHPGLATSELREVFGNLARVAALISPRIARALDLDDALDSTDMLEATDALVEGAAELLIRIARRRGRSVLIVDDLQWMDAASAEALVRVGHRAGEANITVVLGSRSEGGRTAIDRFRDVPHAVVELHRMREDSVGALIASHLSTPTVDPLLVGRINAMADGTPLGVLEVLGAFLDAGALCPHARAWRFDPKLLDAVVLPTGTLALLGRRLAEIPAATRRVLEVAAICGATFSEGRVAAILDVTPETIGYASVTAQRAGVIEATVGDNLRFVHDSLRETLIEELTEDARRRLHQRAGEILSRNDEPSIDELCEAARHFAGGEPERDPALVYRVAAAAARGSLARFDDEASLGFFAQAVAASKLAKQPIPAEIHRMAGDALLRLASVPESIEAFEAALAAASTPLERAALRARIAWAYKTDADPDRAWAALGRAFEELGERLPVENAVSTANTAAQLLRAQIRHRRDRPQVRSAAEIDLLCHLHYLNGRLAFEYGKAARIVQSSLVANALCVETDSLAVRARARGVHAFTVAAFGRPGAGRVQVQEALELGKRSGDPTAAALCVQMAAMVSVAADDLEGASANFRLLVDVYGPWTDLHEYTLHVLSGSMMATWQGRPLEAWDWVERAVARALRSRTTPRTLSVFVHRARAVLASLDREAAPESWLAQQLERVPPSNAGRGYQRLVSWGARAAYYLHRNDLGSDFEALVRDFELEKHNPRTVNVTVGELYMVVGHARLQQCLASQASDRDKYIRVLVKAAADLRLAARSSLLKAHAALIDGALAWLQGSPKKADRLLSEAERLAARENAVWVLSDVARIRAHVLRAAGRHAASRDQARIAESIARQHGALSRIAVLRQELDLPANDLSMPRTVDTSSRHSSRTARQLAVLIQIARGARRDLKTEQLAASILDELLDTLDAERAAIWFQPEVPSLGTAVARHRNSVTSISIAPDSPLGAILRSVHRTGVPWPGSVMTSDAEVFAGFDRARLFVIPLHLYEQPVGALAMERGSTHPEFAPEDRQLLDMLAHQVPIALEVARLLAEREQLHASLQQAQKLEAIGKLAGGLAHDFNNMLAAMKVALAIAQERVGSDVEMAAELDIIAQATTRASQLTSQLLTFSRSKPLPLQVHDVNQLIVSLEPMLRRVAANAVELKLALSPLVDAVSLDSGSFDQALMNLLINARDAMPQGGSFTISSRNIVLDESAAARVNVTPGAYVEVEVADTGEGMSSEVLNRIFEPFFTTKPAGRGTGLGLATVYGFVKNCGGGIHVVSELGVGTRFTLYLKRADRPRARRRRVSSSTSSMPATGIPDTILVVDDDDLVRRSIAKILERNGYRVVAASGQAEALDVARSQQGKRIGLVILDVLLPGVTGPELGRRLNEVLPAKVLFVSGFSAESAPIEDAKVTPDMLLQKPFTQAALLARVRELMPS